MGILPLALPKTARDHLPLSVLIVASEVKYGTGASLSIVRTLSIVPATSIYYIEAAPTLWAISSCRCKSGFQRALRTGDP